VTAKSKIITIIHTSLVSHAHLNELFAKYIPEAEIHNIVDDSLLKETSGNGAGFIPSAHFRVRALGRLTFGNAQNIWQETPL